ARAPAVRSRFASVMRLVAFSLLALTLVSTADAQRRAPPHVDDRAVMAEQPAPFLHHYRFFSDVRMREPNPRVTPYALNTELYSDGALKFRYVYIPRGSQARYSADDVFEFPVGTVLIKTFAFAADMRRPTENVRFLETRLLIRRAEGWIALPYVWNEEQTEARLSVIGANVPVSFTNEEGAAIALDWSVPNVNQCRGCHARAGGNEMLPIGPSARNLNRTVETSHNVWEDGASTIVIENQLEVWTNARLLSGLSPDAPRVPDAYNTSAPIAERARAYLDVNCAHCHNPAGPAHTSGLDLSWSQTDPALWGVLKRPVAAGRGSAGFDFSIEPGHPERSILLHRMQSTDPGVMMPELGRTLVDERAVALMRDWIAGMDENGRAQN
ncbi:MAG TPA: SO2930 family diheme c-type cytochrome, partial [Vitreimonas sp.]|nr:SO2930 family diheme c-type cytochrome [Vitreimonas sp.]